ncbi:MAG TPA: hypothetical protein VFQ41_02065 [Candidatus Angelobacter sp.]|nr:hypothetical protein [Candidatus Angelobacter sp.]
MVSTKMRQVVAGEMNRMAGMAEVDRTYGLQKQRQHAKGKWQSKNQVPPLEQIPKVHSFLFREQNYPRFFLLLTSNSFFNLSNAMGPFMRIF